VLLPLTPAGVGYHLAMARAGSGIARRWLLRIAWGLLVLVIVVLAGSALSNVLLPSRSEVLDRLSDLDKARVEEAFHLRRQLGDRIWAGWAAAEIPLILYNEEQAFLIGCSDPSPGWKTVPHDVRHGGEWQVVPGDAVDGRPYYRQRLTDDGATPQAFTVRIGQAWAASMTTKDWTAIAMGNEIRDGLPSLVGPLVPYRLAARIFTSLAMDTDGYIAAIAHESVHAFQGMVAATRLADAETVLARHGKRYPWDDRRFADAWKVELDALASALSAKDETRAMDLGRTFVSLRTARRRSFDLDADLMNLERLREWEEGLGKYTELALWKLASADSAYQPVPALGRDPDFNQYRRFSDRWTEEMITLRLQAGAGEGRFYYSGMAQAFLLDRLSPGWRDSALRDDVSLEGLLDQAVAPTSGR
jgi:hypothetical protein